MKTYSLFLPVFKQGDDLSHCLEANNGHPIKAFVELAEQYKTAADICQSVIFALSNLEDLDNVEVSGDTHSIYITVEESIAQSLVRESILIEEDFSEEDD